jgi:hypothetical protein
MKKVDNKAFHPYEFKEMPPFLLFFFFFVEVYLTIQQNHKANQKS